MSDGLSASISAKFSAADLKTLSERLNSAEFQKRLTAYTCGDPLPRMTFAVSLLEQGEYQERQVIVQPRPYPDETPRNRCLTFGLSHEIDDEVAALDRGAPINYHYRDPHTGTEMPPRTTRMPKPACDCAKRDAPGNWVTFPKQ
jgi:hypothetical protein